MNRTLTSVCWVLWIKQKPRMIRTTSQIQIRMLGGLGYMYIYLYIYTLYYLYIVDIFWYVYVSIYIYIYCILYIRYIINTYYILCLLVIWRACNELLNMVKLLQSPESDMELARCPENPSLRGDLPSGGLRTFSMITIWLFNIAI